jgi:hypothetical protein
MKKEALFIVNSPLQCICMFEAIQHYAIKDYDVVFRPDTVERNNIMVKTILDGNGLTYKTIHMNHLYSVIPYLFKRKVHYSLLFNGDYYGGGMIAYLYSLIFAGRKAKIIYIDDGVETLRMFTNPPLQRLFRWTQKLMVRLFEILKVVKHIGKPYCFTIFDVHSNEQFEVERNTFEGLRKEIESSPQKGVYIIGTNIYDPYVDKDDCLYLLKQLIVRLKNDYPKEDIWYCPHRRNKDDSELLDILKEQSVNLFNTKISVEYDFVHNKINPFYVAGFGSTALYTLKLIYQGAKVDNVIQKQVIIDDATNAYLKLYDDQLKNIGVETLDLYTKE